MNVGVKGGWIANRNSVKGLRGVKKQGSIRRNLTFKNLKWKGFRGLAKRNRMKTVIRNRMNRITKY